jgi:hypothetical protein
VSTVVVGFRKGKDLGSWTRPQPQDCSCCLPARIRRSPTTKTPPWVSHSQHHQLYPPGSHVILVKSTNVVATYSFCSKSL